MSANDEILPNVIVNAQHGLFWDDRSTTVSADGVSKLDYQDITVWLVTFSGQLPNISLGGALGAPPTTQAAYAPADHTENVVIDATSGAELFQFG